MKRVPQEKIDHGYGRPFNIIDQESVVVNKKVLKRSKVAVYDPREFMSQYKAEDFYLENILAAGAINGLKECRLFQNRLMAEDEIAYEISKMDNFLDREMANLQVNNNNEEKND